MGHYIQFKTITITITKNYQWFSLKYVHKAPPWPAVKHEAAFHHPPSGFGVDLILSTKGDKGP